VGQSVARHSGDELTLRSEFWAAPEKRCHFRELRSTSFRSSCSLGGVHAGSASSMVTLANFQPTPELRHRRRKFKGDVIGVSQTSRNGHNGALFRLIVSLVRHRQSLAGLDSTRHRNQSPRSIDRNRASFFVERIACLRVAVDEERDMDVDPRRYAAIG
jgi:hypothetical protein